jgi:hypothetical protein
MVGKKTNNKEETMLTQANVGAFTTHGNMIAYRLHMSF